MTIPHETIISIMLCMTGAFAAGYLIGRTAYDLAQWIAGRTR